MGSGFEDIKLKGEMAPLIDAMNQHPEDIQHILVHNGQHYDQKMELEFTLMKKRKE